MIKMILMVIFSIKLVSVATVCVTSASGTSGDCSNLSAAEKFFVIYKNQGITAADILINLSSWNFLTIELCSNKCYKDDICVIFDYNCLTGNCDLYKLAKDRNRIEVEKQLVSQNAHITGFYI
jgi:hypothetical protein